MEMIKGKIGEMISRRAKEVNLKYQLNENVPCWNDFQICVIAKCF